MKKNNQFPSLFFPLSKVDVFAEIAVTNMAMHFSLHLMASTEDYTSTQLFMFFMDVSTAAFLAAVCMCVCGVSF